MGQYIIFCHVLDEQVKQHGRSEKAARETIRICRDRNALKEYLNNQEKEVVNTMIMLFDQEYATEAYGRTRLAEGLKEGRKEGRMEGRKEGFLSALVTLLDKGLIGKEDAAAQAGMTLQEFEQATQSLL